MSTLRDIRTQLKTTFLGLAGLLSKLNTMQGDNPNASNSAILDALQGLPAEDYMKNMYSARFEQNEDGDDTYTVVLPIVAGVEAETDHTVIVTI